MWIERTIHSVKTGLACLIGFALVKALHKYLLFDQWLIVTILVVMCAQLSVGSVYTKSVLRFIGTLAGSLLAIFAILFFKDNELAFAGTIALAGMVFSYLATSQQYYSDIGTLGAVTTAIILINPSPTISLSVERFFEIILGIIIAALVSQFILPINARNHLRRNQAATLHLINKFYSQAVADSPPEKEQIIAVDEEIIQSLLTQRKLAKDAKGELLGSRFEPARFKQLMECERGLLRSIDFLNRLYNFHNEGYSRRLLQHNAEWQHWNKKVEELLNKIAQQVESPQYPLHSLTVPSIIPLKESLNQRAAINPEDTRLLEAIFFCLTNISNHLHELAMVVSV